MSETRRSFCRVCHAACPILVEVENSGSVERAVAIKGDRYDPLFEGYTCIKGRQLPDQHHDPERIRTALQRDGSALLPVPTDAALDAVASQLAEIVATHGPRSVASYTGTGAFQNASSAAVAKAWHDGFGSPSFYTSVTIDQPAHRAAALRMGAWEAGWHNFTDSDVSLAVGYNPLVSSYGPASGLQGTNPFVALRRAQERGLTMIVIDPRRTELAAAADLHLQAQPGEDPTLLGGLIRVILDRGLYDTDFCATYVDHLAELEAAVQPFTVDYVSKRAKVPAAQVEAAAEAFAAGPRGSAGTGTGPNMAPHSLLTEHLALTLNIICGRVNQPGDRLESGYFLYPGDTRRAQVIPPSSPTPGPAHRVGGLAGMPGEMLTNRLADEILTPGDGQVRALIVSGGNPVVAFPDQAKTIAAMEALELLVVIDHRHTATTEYADFVFGPRLELERADVSHIMDRRFPAPYVNYTPAVLEPDAGVVAEWEVFAGIAARNGTPIDLPGGAISPADNDDSVLDAVYGNSRMAMSEIRANAGQILPDEAVVVVAGDPAAGRFAVAPADVVAELAEVVGERSGAERLAAFDSTTYPLRLVSRRLKHALNSLGRELPGLRAIATTNYAYVHPADLAAHGIAEGDLVRITSPNGSLVGVAEAAGDLKQGVVAMSHSWGTGSLTDEDVRTAGAPTNRLVSTDDGYDPVTGMAVQSAIPINITPAK